MKVRNVAPLLLFCSYASGAMAQSFTLLRPGALSIPAALSPIAASAVISPAFSAAALNSDITAAAIKPAMSLTDFSAIAIKNPNLELFTPALAASDKAAIKSKPLTYRDPKTGKNISGSTIIENFKGKKVTAAEYYTELNQHEKFLSSLGYDIQVPGEKDFGVIQKAVSKKTFALDQQKLVLSSITATQIKKADLNAFAKPLLTAVSKLDLNAGMIDIHINPPTCTSADTVKRPENWSQRLGDGTFNVDLRAGVNFEATCNRAAGTADGNASATLFSKSFGLAQGKMVAEAVRNQYYRVNLDVFIVGKKVFDYDKTQATKFSKADVYNAVALSKELNIRVPIGPIVLAVNVGVNGKASIGYDVKFDGLSAVATVEPKINSSVYAEAGVDAIVAEAGAGANLVLIQLSLPLTALAEVTPRQGTFQAHGKLFSFIDVRALDGKIYAYFKVYVPRWGIPPWEKKTYTVNLVDWSGYAFQQTLFNYDQWKKLI